MPLSPGDQLGHYKILSMIGKGGLSVFGIALTLWLTGSVLLATLVMALAWGALPVLTAYVGAAETLRPEALIAAASAAFLSLAQRHLSTQVRAVRRRTASVTGAVVDTDGGVEAITDETLIRAPEAALRALVWAVAALALALLVFRLA